jgi:hypothetical protein
MVDLMSEDFENSNGTNERLILGVVEGNDDKRDVDASDNGHENNDENDRTCRQKLKPG